MTLRSMPSVVEEVQRFQPISAFFLIACRREFRRGDVDEHVGAVDFSLTMWESMVGSETS
jgi:hypothetical protein